MAPQFNLIEALGDDGVAYAIRPMVWTLQGIEDAWEKWKNYHILSDDLPANVIGFAYFVTNNGAIWFEVIETKSEQQVGLIFLNQFAISAVTNAYTQALFHAVMWDAKVSVRRVLGKAFLRYLFKAFGFHRLQAEIPLKFGGAIRTLRRLGFTSEGTLRAARRFNGQWYNVAVLGLLETEVGDE